MLIYTSIRLPTFQWLSTSTKDQDLSKWTLLINQDQPLKRLFNIYDIILTQKFLLLSNCLVKFGFSQSESMDFFCMICQSDFCMCGRARVQNINRPKLIRFLFLFLRYQFLFGAVVQTLQESSPSILEENGLPLFGIPLFNFKNMACQTLSTIFSLQLYMCQNFTISKT